MAPVQAIAFLYDSPVNNPTFVMPVIYRAENPQTLTSTHTEQNRL